MGMDALAYRLKVRLPAVFVLAERAARGLVRLRYGKGLAAAREVARLTGTVTGAPAEIRPMTEDDLAAIGTFLNGVPEEYLRFFRPHGFDEPTLLRVLRSPAVQTYGLFTRGDLIAYGTLKASPSGAAYMGQLVAPDWGGNGLGRFLVAYLWWQASVAGLRARATISRANPASMKAHEAVGEFDICTELPNDYLMIEFRDAADTPPTLEIMPSRYKAVL